MKRPKPARTWLAVSMVSAAGWPVSAAMSQEQAIAAPAAPTQPAAPDEAAAQPAPPPAEAQPAAAQAPRDGITFTFKNTPFSQVIDFFARESGLPVIFEAKAPEGSLTFISDQSYRFDEALSILNLNLAMHGVQLRRQDKFLFLASLADSAKKPGMVFSGPLPDGVTPDQVLTLAIPLSNAKAEDVVKQIQPLLGGVGVVVPMPVQNMVLVTDTAAQCRRISEIVRAVDSVRPVDTVYRQFKLVHAKAEEIVNALKGLVSQKVLETIVTADGRKVRTESQDLGGITITADPRTNSIIVVGTATRLQTVEQLVALLDVPETAQSESEMLTLPLSTVPVSVAARKVNELFANVQPPRKPLVIPLEQVSKLALVGPKPLLAQALSLLGAMDPAVAGADGQAGVTDRAVFAKLRHADAADAEALLDRVLSPAIKQSVKVAATPDGKGLVLAGPPAAVAEVQQLLATIDAPVGTGRETRVLKLGPAAGQWAIDRARAIQQARVPDGDDPAGPLSAELDPSSGSLLVSGPAPAVRAFAEALQEVQQILPPARTTRLLEVSQVKAADVVEQLTKLVRSADPINQARKLPDPTIQVVPSANALLVTAEDAQHALIADLLRRLDRLERTDLPTIKLLQLRTAEAERIAGMLAEQYGKRPQSERAEKPVDVRADAATNTLIVSAHPEPFEQIRALVEELNKDKVGPEKVTRLFQLKTAKAADVAAALDKLYPQPPTPVDRLGRPQPWLQPPKPVTVTAEVSTNSLVVYAAEDQLASIQQLAEKLDEVALPPQAELKTYRVLGPSLDAVATTLRSMVARGVLTGAQVPGKPPVPILVESEPRSSTLIIAGDATTFATVERVLKDLSAVPIERGLRIIPIANAKATDVAARAQAIYNAQVAQDPAALPVEISADEKTNTLSVVGDAKGLDRVSRIMDELQRQMGPAREIRLVELKLAKATQVVGFLRDLIASTESLNLRGGAEPVVEPIEATNAILVAASGAQLPIIEGLIRSLDARAGTKRPPLRILNLRTTDAANLAAVLQRSYDSRPTEERGAKPVTIEADPATNTLIVAAHADVLPEIQAVVTELNEQQAVDAQGREIRIFPLKVARAEELARTIDQMYPEPPVPLDPRTRQPRPDLKPPREIIVRADAATNSLIVDAPARRLTAFEDIVKRLDQAKLGDDAEVRTYRVARADLNALATTIRQLVASGSVPGVSATTPVTVTTEPASRTLVVSGPTAVYATVEKVLKDTDAGADSGPAVVKMYALTTARAGQLQPVVERLLSLRVAADAPRDATPDDLQKLFVVAADQATNTLLISASQAVHDAAESLVRSLDQAGGPGTQAEIRVFRLESGDAPGVASALKSSLAAAALPNEPQPSVTAEAASNAVIVSGSSRQLELAGKLVEQMDQLAKPDALAVRTINLTHARAEQVRPVLETVLTQESMLDMLPPAARATVLQRGGVTMQPKVRVAAEPRLNALVVSGPKALLDLAEQMIRELDADPAARSASARSVRVITLVNADAAELARNLEQVFEEDASASPPTVRVDTQSNSLIVRADERQMRTIDEVVARIDTATIAGNRQLRLVSVDRSRADADTIARTLQRLLERKGSVKVEVISTEELLRRQREPRQDEPSRHQPGSFAPVAPGKWTAVVTQVIALAPTPWAVSALEPEPASTVSAAPQPPATQPAAPAREAAPKAAPQEVEPAEARVTIAVDPATNQIILVGPPKLTEQLAALADEIQSQMPADPASVRVVTLPQGVDAGPIAQVVADTVNQIGRRSNENPGGLSGPVTVRPDPTGGAVLVIANEADFGVVGPIVAALAEPKPGQSLTLKVYRLQSIQARQAMEAVRDLIGPAPGGFQARRLRSTDITAPGADGRPVAARIDPASVRMSADPTGASLVVVAPADALGVIDRFVALIDQSPAADRLSIRRYALAHARAAELSRTLQTLFDAQRQGPGRDELPQARFIADERANALLVTASLPQHEEISRILTTADASLATPGAELALIPMRTAAPSSVLRVAEQVLIGRDPARKDTLVMSADDASGLLAVRAPKEDIEKVRELVAQIDRADVANLPFQAVKLERADAQTLAQSLSRFFSDRSNASGRPGGRAIGRVAIVGDRRTGTLMVAAAPEDLEQVKELVKTFDAPAPMRDVVFKVLPLKNARVADIRNTVQELVDQFRWSSWDWSGENQDEGKVFVETNERTNSVVVMGKGEMMDVVERIVAQLDLPDNARAALTIKSVPVAKADLRALRAVLERSFRTPGWRSWQGPDPDSVTVEIDAGRRALLLVGKAEQVALAEKSIAEIEAASGRADSKIEAVTLQHAKADRAAASLNRFFADRARAQGLPEGSPVTILGSPDGNVLIVSAPEPDLATLRDLLAQIDQPELGKDRRVELYVLQNASPWEAAAAVRGMLPRGGRSDEQVGVTALPSQNALIVSAPAGQFEQIDALMKHLDSPPQPNQVNIATINLDSARATEVATALRAALPQALKVQITPVARNNALMLTGSNESIALVLEQIRKIDTTKAKTLTVFRRFKLEHAPADDVAFTLRQMLRARPRAEGEPEPAVDYSRPDNTLLISASADTMPEVQSMLVELDVAPDRARKMEFVKLEFAKAEPTAKALENFFGPFARDATPAARNVTIIPDPATDSLVISADESQWQSVRALLKQLDTEKYDTSQQLVVLPLTHADATTVARALNEGLRAPLQQELDRERVRAERERRGRNPRDEFFDPPAVLIEEQDVPTVSAEPQTNSLIVFSGRKTLDRIRAIVQQLDVPGFARLPDLRVIALSQGKPTQIAETIRGLFLNQTGNARGPRAVMVLGDDSAGALIVRADDEQFAQIKAVADTLQRQMELGSVQAHVLKLVSIPAARVAPTILRTFTPAAQQLGESLAVEVDRGSNALVVACSPRLKEQIERVVRELDQGALGVGDPNQPARLNQSVFIIDVKNSTPQAVQAQLEALGLTRPQPADKPGVVVEPITIVPMSTRAALAVLASPGDGPAVVELVKALDAQPAAPDEHVAVVRLKLAAADRIVQTLERMLDPDAQKVKTGPAAALAEHLRRITLTRTELAQSDVTVDLAKPIRLVPDTESNTVIVGSTPANVAAISDVIRTLDTLPMGDAVVIRIFPLQNAQASRIKAVVEQLFREGEALRRLPGTARQGQPTTATGQALSGDIAVAIDERTNVLIAAGREEAVALVEVLIKDLDSDTTSHWVEPQLIQVKHGDAAAIAGKLNEILVRGLADSIEALGLQKQYGRLRMVAEGKDATDPAARVETDLFAPVNSLVITADASLNAIIVVGTTRNVRVVRELVAMLDVEAASAGNAVRVFPLQNAAADRVARLVQEVFSKREQAPGFRPEDRVIVTSDPRTNALIISSSARSFAIVESLLQTLDRAEAVNTVGLRVIPVEGTNVEDLAPKVQRLMRERIEAASRSGSAQNPLDAFSIEADPVNNLLLVAASDENFNIIKELVAALTQTGQAAALAERTELIALKKTPAPEAAEQITELYVRPEVERRGQNAVSVVPNARLNSLLVSGTDRDIEEVRGLVARIDAAEVHTVRELARIELKSANALEVVTLINNVLSGQGLNGSRLATRQATKIRFIREQLAENLGLPQGPSTEADIDGAVRDLVTLTPDLRTNAVLVNAPPQMKKLIEEVITDLDSTKADRRIERFTLKNADARQMADLLKDVFTLRQQGTAYVLVPTEIGDPESPDRAANLGGPQVPTVTAVPDERQQLAIAVDPRTNTLIVSGTERYLQRVREIVAELDSIQATERIQQIYALKNAKAAVIARTLQQSFERESTRQRATLGPEQTGALARQLEQEVTIVGDENTNSLLIATSPRYMTKVLELVDELDAPPPQVMIQVLLAEVTLDADDTWGMDIDVGPFGGDTYRASSKAGGSGVQTALGVPNLTVSSADFGLLIRALEVQGKLQVLSRPEIMVNNNEPAKLQVGDNIAIATGSERTPQGSVRADIERRDIGIILNVTPSISSDGFVRMEIAPEISALTQRTTQITEDLVAPVINTRTVETTVTVKDGQSVVIGGLIQSTEQERQSKVPIIGDIPLIGLPFRTSQRSDVKTELLVILTPRVVPGRTSDWEARVRELNETALGNLADPSPIRDYIKQQEERTLQNQALPTPPPTPTPAQAPADPAPADTPMPAPSPSPAPADRTPTPAPALPPGVSEVLPPKEPSPPSQESPR